MSAWEDVLLDSGDQRKPAEWWWAYVTDVDPLRIRRELETHPIGSTPSTLIAGLRIGDKVRVVNYLGQAVIIGVAGGATEFDAGMITSGTLDPARRWAGASYAEAAGIATAVFNDSPSATVTFTFPSGRFTSAPIVTASLYTNTTAAYITVARATTATSGEIVVRRDAWVPWTGSINLRWRAVQMTPDSASG